MYVVLQTTARAMADSDDLLNTASSSDRSCGGTSRGTDRQGQLNVHDGYNGHPLTSSFWQKHLDVHLAADAKKPPGKGILHPPQSHSRSSMSELEDLLPPLQGNSNGLHAGATRSSISHRHVKERFTNMKNGLALAQHPEESYHPGPSSLPILTSRQV